ncbi:M1 family metallopeptidase [Thauera linaloolentis]|uniref:Peptidase M1, membrane alanine aminopeptidase n=1 Tax=Thauera linaloolentis (strain DSM 12138 / JCM 21573 / CCUG 41526 / CIP 105981 / IAM 15112 / NBRC 102519 / 47Lol) TaxID=1123367 RepID=N6YEU0_THAL4|nr:M1 family aminopeptidase [Thauera linaloolentis]ENO90040.1 peptidase M1, membrane alanine aminopeptidase [Thauera linaloolentis 47Lol = DSM 12138]MCM8565324.1 M1 family peptidase [Thauera linaloolentis]
MLAGEWPIALDVMLDPASRSLQAEAELQPSERDFRFTLHASLRIDSATVDGKALRIEPNGGRGALRGWRIRLPEQGVLHLRYGGTLPPLDAKLDHRDVLQGMPPMASEAGSYLPAGGAWYPRPAEVFGYRVDVRVPAGHRAVVPGRLVSERLPQAFGGEAANADGGARHYYARFEFEHVADGIDLMAGPWIVRERVVPREAGEALRLRTYFPAALDAEPGLADAYLDDSARYIARYSQSIGAYPFTEFSVVASPLPTGFGMPTLTYLGEQVLRLPFIRATSLGHEVLHNWWGNGVLVDYQSGNWSEGLTTFMADYAYKEAQSATAAREMRLGWLRDFAALPAEAHQPLAAFRSRTHGAAAAVGYGKAAMVFVMLRDLIGEEAFARGIRVFWAQNRFRVAGWKDLRLAFEQASGRGLEDFFQQWLEIPGGAQVRIERARFVVGEGGRGGVLQVDLRQSGPLHALHLPLRLEYEHGGEVRWVTLSRQGEALELPLDHAPLAVRLDPELRVWRRPEDGQLPPILRQWMLHGSPRLVIADEGGEAVAAGRALAERFFERPARLADQGALREGGEPVLLIGTHAAVDRLLATTDLPPRPAPPGMRGSAQVWTVRAPSGLLVAVVSVRDAAALAALQRPLPHYGGQSWLIAEGARVLERGVWDAPGTAVPVEMR